jgi:hypothetical protein
MTDTERLVEKLDKIIRVTDRLELKVETLIDADSHTRLTKLETRNRVLTWVGSVAMSMMALVIGYINLK